jgi:hypothetical protein
MGGGYRVTVIENPKELSAVAQFLLPPPPFFLGVQQSKAKFLRLSRSGFSTIIGGGYRWLITDKPQKWPWASAPASLSSVFQTNPPHPPPALSMIPSIHTKCHICDPVSYHICWASMLPPEFEIRPPPPPPMLISSVHKPHDPSLCGYGNAQKQASGYCVMQKTTLPRIWYKWPV